MKEQKPAFDLVVLCPGTVYGKPMQVLNSLEDLDAASARLWSHITHAKDIIPGDPSPVRVPLLSPNYQYSSSQSAWWLTYSFRLSLGIFQHAGRC